ncbi:MAG: histidine--tRNA ligase [Alicyclobacillus sp.]|nr:histidine--tRNA ligase [Alicyclobacillus sp.]
MAIQRPRGTSDILPEAARAWQELEDVVRRTFRIYNYQEIRTPIFEHTEVFERGVGETTDIVEKEMYTFRDRGDRSLTLRPEGTAGVIRAYVENKLYGNPGLTKLYYIGPMFRYEKPQKGRERQFHQYGCEVLGSEGPAIDGEVIALHVDTVRRFGVNDIRVELNSVGCPVCRPGHKQAMLEALRPHRQRLCKDCQNRLERNPLRIFDCKNGCRNVLEEAGVPSILSSLCDACREHFDGVQAALQQLGVPFVVTEDLVRGLDYYTRTAWEVRVEGLGAIGGGGRYNGLVKELGGPDMPGIGFAAGMERVLLARESQGTSEVRSSSLQVYVALADDTAEAEAASLVQRLRTADIVADRDYQGRSLKAQMKQADREGASLVLILGAEEVARQVATMKDLTTGEQMEVPLADVVGRVERKVGQHA